MIEKFILCPVCNRAELIVVRQVNASRINKQINLYHCQSCRSFCNPSDYIEDAQQLEADLAWNLNVADRNREWSRLLLNSIIDEQGSVNSVLEIGCGVGTTLDVAAKEFSMQATGYDINKQATNWGQEHYHLALYPQLWKHGLSANTDLTLCISVLEHLDKPLALIEQLCLHTKASQGALFISVPQVNCDKWHYIDHPDAKGSPFIDNSVHITHFSKIGLLDAIEAQGLSCKPLSAGGWNGFLAFANTDPARHKKNLDWSRSFHRQQNLQLLKHLHSSKGSQLLSRVIAANQQ